MTAKYEKLPNKNINPVCLPLPNKSMTFSEVTVEKACENSMTDG